MVNSESFETTAENDKNPKEYKQLDAKTNDTTKATSPRHLIETCSQEDILNYTATTAEMVSKDEKTTSQETANEPTSQDTNIKISTRSTEAENNNEKISTSLQCSVPLNKINKQVLNKSDSDNMLDDKSNSESKSDSQKSVRRLLCLFCDRTFISQNLKQKHMDRCHSGGISRRFSARTPGISQSATACWYCSKLNKTNHTLKDLLEHLVKEHSNRYFACLTCEERFSTQTKLRDHNKTIHNIEEELVKEIKAEITEDSSPEQTSRSSSRIRKTIKEKQEETRSSAEDSDSDTTNTTQLKSTRNKKFSVKSAKNGVKTIRTTRLQAKLNSKKQKTKQKQKVEEKQKTISSKSVYNSSSVFSLVNLFTYKYEKIYDHASDGVKDANSGKFDAVFDKEFYLKTVSNIKENLLFHLDGKLNLNPQSENRISNFEQSEQSKINQENFGCDVTLNAITPVASLPGSSSYENLDDQIEYASKATKKSTKRDKNVKYKFPNGKLFTPKSKTESDLTCLDMWTQLRIKERQRLALSRQENLSTLQRSARAQREELNTILERRGPFEDLRVEALEDSIKSKDENPNYNPHRDVNIILEEILSNVFRTDENRAELPEMETKPKKEREKSVDLEIPMYLNLQKSPNKNEVSLDLTDKATLTCIADDTENRNVELTGEWARPRIYICATCALKVPNLKALQEHKNNAHPNIYSTHYEFVGKQSEYYKHLGIPGLGKVGIIEMTPINKLWVRSNARTCSKCTKTCHNLGELHRHILECGGDWQWMLARRKCKYRPYGAKRRRQRGYKRTINPDIPRVQREPRPKTVHVGPRPRPSDAETIQRMLANLPAKRNRKMISMRDSIQGPRKPYRRNNLRSVSTLHTENASRVNSQSQRVLRNRISQVTNKALKNSLKRKINARVLRNRNAQLKLHETEVEDSESEEEEIKRPIGTRRRLATRTFNRVLGSKILDSNSTLITRRQLGKAVLQNNLRTRLRSRLRDKLNKATESRRPLRNRNEKDETTDEPIEKEKIEEEKEKVKKSVGKRLLSLVTSKNKKLKTDSKKDNPEPKPSPKQEETEKPLRKKVKTDKNLTKKVQKPEETTEVDTISAIIDSVASNTIHSYNPAGLSSFIRKKASNLVQNVKNFKKTSEKNHPTEKIASKIIRTLSMRGRRKKTKPEDTSSKNNVQPKKKLEIRNDSAENASSVKESNTKIDNEKKDQELEKMPTLEKIEEELQFPPKETEEAIPTLTPVYTDSSSKTVLDSTDVAKKIDFETEPKAQKIESKNSTLSKLKNKFKRSGKGLNDCIAMLRNKLEKTTDPNENNELDKPNESKTVLEIPTVAKNVPVLNEDRGESPPYPDVSDRLQLTSVLDVAMKNSLLECVKSKCEELKSVPSRPVRKIGSIRKRKEKNLPSNHRTEEVPSSSLFNPLLAKNHNNYNIQHLIEESIKLESLLSRNKYPQNTTQTLLPLTNPFISPEILSRVIEAQKIIDSRSRLHQGEKLSKYHPINQKEALSKLTVTELLKSSAIPGKSERLPELPQTLAESLNQNIYNKANRETMSIDWTEIRKTVDKLEEDEPPDLINKTLEKSAEERKLESSSDLTNFHVSEIIEQVVKDCGVQEESKELEVEKEVVKIRKKPGRKPKPKNLVAGEAPLDVPVDVEKVRKKPGRKPRPKLEETSFDIKVTDLVPVSASSPKPEEDTSRKRKPRTSAEKLMVTQDESEKTLELETPVVETGISGKVDVPKLKKKPGRKPKIQNDDTLLSSAGNEVKVRKKPGRKPRPKILSEQLVQEENSAPLTEEVVEPEQEPTESSAGVLENPVEKIRKKPGRKPKPKIIDPILTSEMEAVPESSLVTEKIQEDILEELNSSKIIESSDNLEENIFVTPKKKPGRKPKKNTEEVLLNPSSSTEDIISNLAEDIYRRRSGRKVSGKIVDESSSSELEDKFIEEEEPIRRRPGRKPKAQIIEDSSSSEMDSPEKVALKEDDSLLPIQNANLEETVANEMLNSESLNQDPTNPQNSKMPAPLIEKVRKKPGRKPKPKITEDTPLALETSSNLPLNNLQDKFEEPSSNLGKDVEKVRKKPGRKPKAKIEDGTSKLGEISINEPEVEAQNTSAELNSSILEDKDNAEKVTKKPGRKPKAKIEDFDKTEEEEDQNILAELNSFLKEKGNLEETSEIIKKKPGRKPRAKIEEEEKSFDKPKVETQTISAEEDLSTLEEKEEAGKKSETKIEEDFSLNKPEVEFQNISTEESEIGDKSGREPSAKIEEDTSKLAPTSFSEDQKAPAEDISIVLEETSEIVKKKAGRKPKAKIDEVASTLLETSFNDPEVALNVSAEVTSSTLEEMVPPELTKKRPGRKPRSKIEEDSSKLQIDQTASPLIEKDNLEETLVKTKKKPGRKPRTKIEEDASKLFPNPFEVEDQNIFAEPNSSTLEETPIKNKKKPGRKPKAKIEEVTSQLLETSFNKPDIEALIVSAELDPSTLEEILEINKKSGRKPKAKIKEDTSSFVEISFDKVQTVSEELNLPILEEKPDRNVENTSLNEPEVEPSTEETTSELTGDKSDRNPITKIEDDASSLVIASFSDPSEEEVRKLSAEIEKDTSFNESEVETQNASAELNSFVEVEDQNISAEFKLSTLEEDANLEKSRKKSGNTAELNFSPFKEDIEEASEKVRKKPGRKSRTKMEEDASKLVENSIEKLEVRDRNDSAELNSSTVEENDNVEEEMEKSWKKLERKSRTKLDEDTSMINEVENQNLSEEPIFSTLEEASEKNWSKPVRKSNTKLDEDSSMQNEKESQILTAEPNLSILEEASEKIKKKPGRKPRAKIEEDTSKFVENASDNSEVDQNFSAELLFSTIKETRKQTGRKFTTKIEEDTFDIDVELNVSSVKENDKLEENMKKKPGRKSRGRKPAEVEKDKPDELPLIPEPYNPVNLAEIEDEEAPLLQIDSIKKMKKKPGRKSKTKIADEPSIDDLPVMTEPTSGNLETAEMPPMSELHDSLIREDILLLEKLREEIFDAEESIDSPNFEEIISADDSNQMQKSRKKPGRKAKPKTSVITQMEEEAPKIEDLLLATEKVKKKPGRKPKSKTFIDNSGLEEEKLSSVDLQLDESLPNASFQVEIDLTFVKKKPGRKSKPKNLAETIQTDSTSEIPIEQNSPAEAQSENLADTSIGTNVQIEKVKKKPGRKKTKNSALELETYQIEQKLENLPSVGLPLEESVPEPIRTTELAPRLDLMEEEVTRIKKKPGRKPKVKNLEDITISEVDTSQIGQQEEEVILDLPIEETAEAPLFDLPENLVLTEEDPTTIAKTKSRAKIKPGRKPRAKVIEETSASELETSQIEEEANVSLDLPIEQSIDKAEANLTSLKKGDKRRKKPGRKPRAKNLVKTSVLKKNSSLVVLPDSEEGLLLHLAESTFETGEDLPKIEEDLAITVAEVNKMKKRPGRKSKIVPSQMVVSVEVTSKDEIFDSSGKSKIQTLDDLEDLPVPEIETLEELVDLPVDLPEEELLPVEIPEFISNINLEENFIPNLTKPKQIRRKKKARLRRPKEVLEDFTSTDNEDSSVTEGSIDESEFKKPKRHIHRKRIVQKIIEDFDTTENEDSAFENSDTLEKSEENLTGKRRQNSLSASSESLLEVVEKVDRVQIQKIVPLPPKLAESVFDFDDFSENESPLKAPELLTDLLELPNKRGRKKKEDDSAPEKIEEIPLLEITPKIKPKRSKKKKSNSALEEYVETEENTFPKKHRKKLKASELSEENEIIPFEETDEDLNKPIEELLQNLEKDIKVIEEKINNRSPRKGHKKLKIHLKKPQILVSSDYLKPPQSKIEEKEDFPKEEMDPFEEIPFGLGKQEINLELIENDAALPNQIDAAILECNEKIAKSSSEILSKVISADFVENVSEQCKKRVETVPPLSLKIRKRKKEAGIDFLVPQQNFSGKRRNRKNIFEDLSSENDTDDAIIENFNKFTDLTNEVSLSLSLADSHARSLEKLEDKPKKKKPSENEETIKKNKSRRAKVVSPVKIIITNLTEAPVAKEVVPFSDESKQIENEITTADEEIDKELNILNQCDQEKLFLAPKRGRKNKRVKKNKKETDEAPKVSILLPNSDSEDEIPLSFLKNPEIPNSEVILDNDALNDIEDLINEKDISKIDETILDISYDIIDKSDKLLEDINTIEEVLNQQKTEELPKTPVLTEEKEEDLITTPDLNNTSLVLKIQKNCRLKKGRKPKGIKKVQKLNVDTMNHCQICNKSFTRIENLIKHKRTLTHISKLSEIEAKENEEKLKKEALLPEVDLIEKGINLIGDLSTDLEKSETFPVIINDKTTNLKLVDIISDVLDKPTDDLNLSEPVLTKDLTEISSKRYKSMAERKSFDSDTYISLPKENEGFIETNNQILSKQLSLLENMIEKTNPELNYIEDSLLYPPNHFEPPDKPYPSTLLSNFIKPTETKIPDDKKRKILNRDEELFLECCSLLKSGSEISNSKKRNWEVKVLPKEKSWPVPNSRVETPIGEPYVNNDWSNSNSGVSTDWQTQKNKNQTDLSKPTPLDFHNAFNDSLKESEMKVTTKDEDEAPMKSEDETLMKVSVTGGDEALIKVTANSNDDTLMKVRNEDLMEVTPRGDDEDLIKEIEETPMNDGDKSMEEPVKDEVVPQEEVDENLKRHVVSAFGGLMAKALKCRMKAVVRRSHKAKEKRTFISTLQPVITDFATVKKLPEIKESEPKKIVTKGAKKVFEGIKVSIPTQDLNLTEVLKGNKKDETADTKKDVYDYEESEPTFENVFTANEEVVEETRESESDTDRYYDSNSFEGSISSDSLTQEVEEPQSKQPEKVSKETQKKCVIMGRIFKNASKPKLEDKIPEIRDISSEENSSKMLENYLDSYSLDNFETLENKNITIINSKNKMTTKEMDILFDKLLNDYSKTEEPEEEKPNTKIVEENQKKPKVRQPKKKQRRNSEDSSTTDEFVLPGKPAKTSSKKHKKQGRRPTKKQNGGINLEQEIKECIGVAGRKSQRKCTSGKQNVLTEFWSSDESIDYAELIPEEKPKGRIGPVEETDLYEFLPDLDEAEEPILPLKHLSKEDKSIKEKIVETFEEPEIEEKKVAKKRGRKKRTDNEGSTGPSPMTANRRKRNAAETLYYWSSTSDEEVEDLIEVKPIREEIIEEERPMQHGWIVGDSPKKLVTMLAQAKGSHNHKKVVNDSVTVKEQNKKMRTTV